VKKRKVIDAGGVEHIILIPENERDKQIVQGYSVGGIGHPDKSARRRKNLKSPKKVNKKSKGK
jgi:hypothetical protein